MLTTDIILSLTPGRRPVAELDPATGVSFHSSRVRPGDAFFALPGANQHGISFAAAALERGAAFIVSDRAHPMGVTVDDPRGALLALGNYARSQLSDPVIGVSGSAGKTSTKAFLAYTLGAKTSPGNYNTPLALASVLTDTWLQGNHHQPLVLELGIDHRGEMAELLDLVKPTHGLLTIIAESHLSGIGTLSSVAEEKARLLAASEVGLASLQAAQLLPARLKERVYTYALAGQGATFEAELLEQTPFQQRIRFEGVTFTLPYPGRAMAENATGALAMASLLGNSIEASARSLERAVIEPGRLQHRRIAGALVLDDTYNSNPASARLALEVLSGCPPPRTAILGDMLELGERGPALHEELGRLTRGIEHVIAVGPLGAHLKRGNPEAKHLPDTEAALSLIGDIPLEGSLLIKASRGMRFEKLIDEIARNEGTR